MVMEKRVFELEFNNTKIVIEIGELAKQANSACLVRYGDTAVLTAVTVSKDQMNLDFFPLTVLYNEKFYAVGKIPGGFIKREGRPSEHATLTARLIDRPLRPLFPEGFRNEVQVVNTVLSVDQDKSPELTALFASSLALSISEIPFNGPVAGVVVGRIDGKFIINPTPSELEKSDINLTVAGTTDAVNMVEADAKEVPEKDILSAIMFGHKAIKKLIEFQNEIIKEVGREKFAFEMFEADDILKNKVENIAREKIITAIQTKEKKEREEKLNAIREQVLEQIENEYSEDEKLEEILKQVILVLDDIEREEVRKLIIEKKIRPDGRKPDEIRALNSQVDILPRTHGSALFTRGQTQVLSVCTLGALGEHQILDGLGVEEDKRFMHHYNFPAFSVGEVGRYGAPGRREIGHGALGERALLQVIPSEEEFPYTIRLVSEVLESNGSSSQASICAASMALMSAGVPIKDQVAGIAMGLISNGKKHIILTDIQGIEDRSGDMDFKVAGTKNGICALQMDIKISGLSEKILKDALEQARKGRMEILKNMNETISEPRKELSKYAPKIKQLRIDPDQIRDIIGPGGKVINKIIEESDDVKIDIEQDGRIIIYHHDYAMIEKAAKIIEELTREAKIGEIYSAKVIRIEKFGVFVELWPGCEGLIHISQLDEKRVEKAEDVVKIGDEILVKVIERDERGRLNLSRKEALKQTNS
ncbi:MAG TPA: polyribonucleotide nucleotidyltransferase [Tenericutes bacterium]|nr:polyribonucleotide nucleotidyltransferase [Mycoplasmatota bacterium]